MGARLQAVGLEKEYGAAMAVDGVDLDARPGEFVSLLGPSGCGKTTSLRLIAGLERPDAGRIAIDGRDVTDVPPQRRGLGMVFQQYALFPNLTAYENIAFALRVRRLPKAEIERRVAELLAVVHLEDAAGRYPHQLSGGMQQRVAIARALANDPPIVIADEPTGNLDSKTADSVFELFTNLVAQGKTIIIVTHDSSLAKRTHRTALIADGEIVNEYVAKAMPTLSRDRLLQATREAKEQHYEAGTMILSEGTNADAFYVVTQGTVEVVLPRANQSDVVAVQLGPGKYFGEMEFFHEKKHRASIRASEHGPVEVIAISYDKLNELLTQSDVTREALHQSADQHEAENVKARGAIS